MPHDLIGTDTHLKRMPGGLEYCQCWGPCCVNTTTLDCICEDGCDCRTKNSPLLPVRTPVETKPDHTCEECGTEVFRNGTRGRYPKLCPDCRVK